MLETSSLVSRGRFSEERPRLVSGGFFENYPPARTLPFSLSGSRGDLLIACITWLTKLQLDGHDTSTAGYMIAVCAMECGMRSTPGVLRNERNFVSITTKPHAVNMAT